MTTKQSAAPGSFVYLEAKLRKEAKGTGFGKAFEHVIKKRLIEAPNEFKVQFNNVWLWEEWPKNWGIDKGIDLIAEDMQGKIWAIQVKNYKKAYVIPKKGIDSFISESERDIIDKRMLIATTDKIGPNAKELFSSLKKKCVLVMRGDLISQKTPWPTSMKENTEKEPRKSPRPDQQKAIKEVLNGFKKHKRGRMIRACGTGKTLISLWIKEELKPKRTLVLFPSISLVAQTVEAWNKQKKDDYEYLIICSDETTSDGDTETASSYGIDVTTDIKEIHGFLNRKTTKPLIVFSTYQSSKLLKEAQKDCPDFDLIVFDEAHRCTGYMGRQFTYALDDKNIRGKKRLFMTATERYIKQVIKDKAGEVDFEIASMDDESLYGPIFHELNFGQAIEKQLLNNYQVAIVIVSEDEAREMVEKGKLIKTRSGILSDARTMATQMAIAKAMKKYDITKMITFHSSVKKAKDFINEEKDDSLPSTIKMMKTKPAKSLWYGHISGKTAASQRKSLLNEFKSLPKTTKAILTNCSCLKEGVDIPSLDGIAFVDPKSSIIDIVQAIGRAIRKTPDNKPGTIIVPVFINPDDEEEALDSSAFKIVGYVLKALQQHDESLREELEGYRLEVGKRRASGKVRIPSQVKVDIHTILPQEFEQNLLVKIIKVGAKKPDLTEEKILEWADLYYQRNQNWPIEDSGSIDEAPEETWNGISVALGKGGRGLKGGHSLAKLLEEHRGLRNRMNLPSLSVDQILQWADEHFKRTKKWPKQKSGQVIGAPGEMWSAIGLSLVRGKRGLKGGSSIAKLLEEHRGIRNQKNLPSLTVDQILKWADEYYGRTHNWPTKDSGEIQGSDDENWLIIDNSLRGGNRGLPKNSSLIKLLQEHRGVRNIMNLPKLTEEQILQWADAYHKWIKQWPTQFSGAIYGTKDEKWSSVNISLAKGTRSLKGGSSLAKFLQKHRGVRNKQNLPPLTVDQILQWADEYHKRTGKWPKRKADVIQEADGETWYAIDGCLRQGLRGLPKDSSLAKILEEHRGVRNKTNLTILSEEKILKWARAYNKRHGIWPTHSSGPIDDAPGETWNAVNLALSRGSRGLKGNSSLHKLLKKHIK